MGAHPGLPVLSLFPEKKWDGLDYISSIYEANSFPWKPIMHASACIVLNLNAVSLLLCVWPYLLLNVISNH